jgi:hypothetical protein
MAKKLLSLAEQKNKLRQRITDDKAKLKKLEEKHILELGQLAYKAGLGDFALPVLEKRFAVLAAELVTE